MKNGIDVALYGVGTAKTVGRLFAEIEAGECRLYFDGGMLIRVVEPLFLTLKACEGDEVRFLVEETQRFADGRVRERNLVLGEKLQPGESWGQAAMRALDEELYGDLAVRVDALSYRKFVSDEVSRSYPGLLSRYVSHQSSIIAEERGG